MKPKERRSPGTAAALHGYMLHRPQRYKMGFELANDWRGFGDERPREQSGILTFTVVKKYDKPCRAFYKSL